MFRAVGRAAVSGNYVPAPERRRYIPRQGRSPRPLDIGTVADRTVAASLAGLMAPLLEMILTPYSFAYRLGRRHLDMLAWLATIAKEEGRWVVGNHDVAQAFPSVPLNTVNDAFARLVAHVRRLTPAPTERARERRQKEDEELLQFIATVLCGADASGRECGLSQGNPFSPVAMELYMYSVLDSVTHQDPSSPLRLRYSDNIVALPGSVREG